MLAEIIARLKREGAWQHFESAIVEMKEDLIKDLTSGQVKTIESLFYINGQLDMLDRFKHLEKYNKNIKKGN